MNLTIIELHQHLLADLGLESWLESVGLPHEWVEFFTHFLIDSLNLFLILIIVMFGVSLLQSFIPVGRLQEKLSALGSVWGYVLAIAMGVISPFCSCTIIPVVMGLIAVGVPVQTSLCYLTAAALLNGSALVTLYSTFGLRFGLFYTVASLLMAVGVSLILRPVAGAECVLDSHAGHVHGCCEDGCGHEPTTRMEFCWHNVWHVLRSTWGFMLLSVAISSAVMAFVPMELLQSLLGEHNLFSPLLAGLVGAPLHGDVFAILPLLQILEPINFAAAMAFALATMAISIPEALLLTRVFRPKTVAAYALALTGCSLLAGYAALLVG